ncbi:hypothetical protein BCR42DRAFT_300923, partial [Absidia repens]
LEPEAHGDILEISNLAPEIDDVHRLYDIFRPFGPLQLCISNGEGTAMIQYFNRTNSDEAIHQMHDNDLQQNRQQSEHQHMQNHDHQNQQQTPIMASKSHIDYMNLYVKNMDHQISNHHLHTLFGKFGRIISARVISHSVTKQSKGYGFVSFSREDEAARALEEMNGLVVFSKPLYVSYHVPKKGRNDQTNNRNNSTIKPSPVFSTIPSNNDTVQQAPNMRKYPQYTYQLNPPTVIDRPIANAPLTPEQRRISIESMASITTDTSTSIQRLKLTDAVLQYNCCSKERVSDIVDLLMTLRRRERSLCLFNADFLMEKVNLALESLDIFDDD